MAAEYTTELATLESRVTKGERLTQDEQERYENLRATTQAFEKLDSLQSQMADVDRNTQEYRRKAMEGYDLLISNLQALAGLDSSRSGVFEAQIPLTRMFLTNERLKVQRVFLRKAREAEEAAARRTRLPMAPTPTRDRSKDGNPSGKAPTVDDKKPIDDGKKPSPLDLYWKCIETAKKAGTSQRACEQLLKRQGQ